jgi:hypothetical protein
VDLLKQQNVVVSVEYKRISVRIVALDLAVLEE